MTTERDCKHGQLARSCNVCELESEVARQAAEIERLHDYDTKLSAVMPADYKDWHEGSKREWPELAAESIKMWRDRANEAYVEIERANALLRQAFEALIHTSDARNTRRNQTTLGGIMILPNDIARCRGVGSDEEGWREGCEDCKRRTSAPSTGVTVWMTPPDVIVFWCEYRLRPTEDV